MLEVNRQYQRVLALQEARALIEDPNDWCQFRLEWTDGEGHTRRCLMGAFLAAGITDGNFFLHGEEPLVRRLGELAAQRDPQVGCYVFPSGLNWSAQFNNSHTHAEVLALLDALIAEEEAHVAAE